MMEDFAFFEVEFVAICLMVQDSFLPLNFLSPFNERNLFL